VKVNDVSNFKLNLEINDSEKEQNTDANLFDEDKSCVKVKK